MYYTVPYCTIQYSTSLYFNGLYCNIHIFHTLTIRTKYPPVFESKQYLSHLCLTDRKYLVIIELIRELFCIYNVMKGNINIEGLFKQCEIMINHKVLSFKEMYIN